MCTLTSPIVARHYRIHNGLSRSLVSDILSDTGGEDGVKHKFVVFRVILRRRVRGRKRDRLPIRGIIDDRLLARLRDTGAGLHAYGPDLQEGEDVLAIHFDVGLDCGGGDGWVWVFLEGFVRYWAAVRY